MEDPFNGNRAAKVLASSVAHIILWGLCYAALRMENVYAENLLAFVMWLYAVVLWAYLVAAINKIINEKNTPVRWVFVVSSTGLLIALIANGWISAMVAAVAAIFIAAKRSMGPDEDEDEDDLGKDLNRLQSKLSDISKGLNRR